MAQKQARDDKIKELKEKMKLGGVKGLTAKNELIQLESQDMTEMNRVELTLVKDLYSPKFSSMLNCAV